MASATTAAGPVSGWLTVKAPFSLEIREEGRIVGTTDADRLMLAAGPHTIELVNETLGYRVTRTVQVMPGKVASLAVDLPKGVVNLNATPWAEVWVDGQRVGETPIGNLSIRLARMKSCSGILSSARSVTRSQSRCRGRHGSVSMK